MSIILSPLLLLSLSLLSSTRVIGSIGLLYYRLGLRGRLDRGLERVVGGSSCDSARKLVAASMVAEIDEGSKGLLNEPRFEIFGVDLWYKIRGRSQTIVRLRNSNQVAPSAGPFALRPSLRDLPWRAADWLRSLQEFAGV